MAEAERFARLHRGPVYRARRRRLATALLVAAGFLAGVMADRALAASRPAPVIPADQGKGVVAEPDRELDRELAEAPMWLASASPSPTVTSAPRHGLSGIATWYATGPNGLYAAAGPGLRRALGPGWRGQYVTVCRAACVRVRLIDWCGCSPTRVIDLSDEAFRALGQLSRGVLRVEVSW